jgi:ribosomal-protein-alanine N-acetyltransferase
MTLEDVPTVSEVERAVFTMPWSAGAFRYELAHNHSATYLVLRYTPWAPKRRGIPRQVVWRLPHPDEIDRSILGYGGLWMMLDEGHICTLGIRAEWRGRGLGELLLWSLIQAAHQRGASIVTLEVRESNAVAQGLYRKYGLEVAGRRKGYYTDNHEDALIMSIEGIDTPDYQARLAHKAKSLRQHLLAFGTQPPVSAQ